VSTVTWRKPPNLQRIGRFGQVMVKLPEFERTREGPGGDALVQGIDHQPVQARADSPAHVATTTHHPRRSTRRIARANA